MRAADGSGGSGPKRAVIPKRPERRAMAPETGTKGATAPAAITNETEMMKEVLRSPSGSGPYFSTMPSSFRELYKTEASSWLERYLSLSWSRENAKSTYNAFPMP